VAIPTGSKTTAWEMRRGAPLGTFAADIQAEVSIHCRQMP
jgi:hypothetical protein